MKHTKDSDLATHESFAPASSIPGVDYLKRVNEAVWTIDPAELREQNTKKLQDAGVDEKLIQRFMTNENLSPFQQTLMLTTLTEMQGVEGREVMLEIAAEADSVDVAEFKMANTLMAEKFDDMVVAERDLWVRGRASDEFVTEMQDLGWGLHQQVDLAAKVK